MLGDSIAAANGQQADPLGDFIAKNQPSWDTRAATYDQIVGAFSQSGGNRSAGVQLAAGPGFSGIGTGGDNGGYDYERSYVRDNETFVEASRSPFDDDGRGFIDEVRSATEGPINQRSAIGTPLPPSPYRWVSNEMVGGELVREHWADGTDTGDDSARLMARAKDSPAMRQWAQNYYNDGANSVNAAERANGFADNTNHSIRSDGTLLGLGRRLIQDIPFLADVKNESAAPLHGYVNDMFALSNDPKAPLLTRWAAQQSAASGINMLSEFDAGFPTNTLGVASSLLGGSAVVKGINADIKAAKAFGSLTDGELGALRYAGLSDAEIANHIAVNGDVYLFRGTSPGWAGSPGAQNTAVSAAVDPYSATVFALEARAQSGSGVVQYGTRSQIGTFAEGSYAAVREREVGLPMTSLEFANRAPNTIPVDMARQALQDMGLPSLPHSVQTSTQRGQLLNDVPRMTPEQVADFLRRVGK
ncbi:hypothetical protein [Variovorax boronicumulans]|uniref:hypothetical protein n=1 Tax=Variovorax boronicumulans TaxID=436515 RepID=UPI002789E783|nr:hypothetical protein [Variovorax boronicumulans]MDQ0045674.1 hypothetical protein [Variovorax boronicumulans]